MIVLVSAIVIILLIAFFLHYRHQGSIMQKKIAFFHPYCNNGGGGERVLWILVANLLQDESLKQFTCIYIYTGDTDRTPLEIIENVKVS